MTERRYTVEEIDALRQACRLKLAGKTPDTVVAFFDDPDWEEFRKIEEMVRTYMLAGVTAADIRAVIG